jgi:hypothetical protein
MSSFAFNYLPFSLEMKKQGGFLQEKYKKLVLKTQPFYKEDEEEAREMGEFEKGG